MKKKSYFSFEWNEDDWLKWNWAASSIKLIPSICIAEWMVICFQSSSHIQSISLHSILSFLHQLNYSHFTRQILLFVIIFLASNSTNERERVGFPPFHGCCWRVAQLHCSSLLFFLELLSPFFSSTKRERESAEKKRWESKESRAKSPSGDWAWRSKWK